MRLVVAFIGLTATAPRAANLLTNGSFDALPAGTAWVQTGPGALPIISDSSPVTEHSAPYLAWLGQENDLTLSLHQTVSVPMGTTHLQLRGEYWITTEETPGGTIYDDMRVELRSGGSLLETLKWWSNLNTTSSWTPFTIDAVGNYAGQTIRLEFRSTNDNAFPTNFFIDSVVLDATVPTDVPVGSDATAWVSPAAPNPTRGPTWLRLELPNRAWVRAGVYDLMGRQVSRIVDGPLEAGGHSLTWNGADTTGGRAAPGVYVCRVDCEARSFERLIAVIR
jgi:hypothetical protein